MIAQERHRQIATKGYSMSHDQQHTKDELSLAAACYATPDRLRNLDGSESKPNDWPFGVEWWKPDPENRIRELVKAGALIVAELDRLRGVKHYRGFDPAAGIGREALVHQGRPEIGREVVGWHPDWQDDDNNPEGIRLGFLTETGEGWDFVSTWWNDYQDAYQTAHEAGLLPLGWAYLN